MAAVQRNMPACSGGLRQVRRQTAVSLDDALMAAWAQRRVVIAVRIDPRADGMVRLDSDIARQLGLVREH
jgi:hypothetical protein